MERLDAPNVDPDSGGTAQLNINPAWLAIVRGKLTELLDAQNWNYATPADLELIQARVFLILNILNAGYPGQPLYQVNATTHIPEVSFDGGATFTPAPQASPQHSVYFPPLTGSDIPCRSAASAVWFIKHTLDQLVSMSTAGLQLTSMAYALMIDLLDLGPWGWLLDVILLAVTGLIDIGAGVISSSMTTGVYDSLRCILDCHFTSDGTMTPTGLSGANTDVDTLIGGTAAAIIHLVLGLMGEGGVTNAGRRSYDTHSCSGCGCYDCVNYSDSFTGGLGAQSHIPTAPYANPSNPTQFGGAWTNSIGHAANGCIQNTTTSAGQHCAGIMIDLGKSCHITSIAAWFRKTIAGGAVQNWALHDESLGPLASFTVNDDYGLNTWTKRTYTINVNNVRYVFLSTTVNSSASCYLDDVDLVVTP